MIFPVVKISSGERLPREPRQPTKTARPERPSQADKRHHALIGLAIAEGTGVEIADVFIRIIERLATMYSVDLTIKKSPRLYQTYQSLITRKNGACALELTKIDAAHYERYCRQLAKLGADAVFRTAMNAQSLYLVRQRLGAVKIEHLCADRAHVMLVRDEAQGFYTGENSYEFGKNVITRSCSFSRRTTEAIVEFAVREARRQWGHNAIQRTIMAYKFHLLDGVFTSWIKDWSIKFGVKIELYQPDTVNRNIIRDGLNGHVLLIGANEWADIMHAVLLQQFGLDAQESRFTRNVYLDPRVNRLVEYQTVHGSADDIAGKGIVNPVATIRAAAAIMEHHAGCQGVQRATEESLECVAERGIVTPDLGGKHRTERVVETFLKILDERWASRTRNTAFQKTASPEL
jgi:isocitrate/isopropylmalate dehydrogenase